MNNSEFKELLDKYTAEAATETERFKVEYFLYQLRQNNQDLPVPLGDAQQRGIKNRIDSALASPVKTVHLQVKKYYAWAAAIAVLIGVSAFLASSIGQNTITVSSARGEHKEITLADGSHIFLNANSSIAYEKDFESRRDVTLKGEAFFEVAHNPSKPFTVTSGAIKTHVLGTSFNINSSEKMTIIGVKTGKVAVKSANNPQKRAVLTKNQQIVFEAGKTTKINRVDGLDITAWTRNEIVLNQTSLLETAKLLENQYDVTIDFEDKSLKNYTLSGKFKDEKLENVLSSIALLKNLTIEYLTPKHILIRKKIQQS